MESNSFLLVSICPRVEFLWPDMTSGSFAPPGALEERAMAALEPCDREKNKGGG